MSVLVDCEVCVWEENSARDGGCTADESVKGMYIYLTDLDVPRWVSARMSVQLDIGVVRIE